MAKIIIFRIIKKNKDLSNIEQIEKDFKFLGDLLGKFKKVVTEKAGRRRKEKAGGRRKEEKAGGRRKEEKGGGRRKEEKAG